MKIRLVACCLYCIFLCASSQTALAGDEKMLLGELYPGVSVSILRPDGWSAIQAQTPIILSADPLLEIVATLSNSDETIIGEVKFVEKKRVKPIEAREFYKEFAQQVLGANVQYSQIMDGDEDVGVYRNQYVLANGSILVEQICNGPVGAVSLSFLVSPGSLLFQSSVVKTIGNMLNSQGCKISKRN